MGLLSEIVKMKVGCSSLYYEKLGYNVPKHYIKHNHSSLGNKYAFSLGEYFDVKVKDLPLTSRVLVEVECDECGKRNNLPYSSITSTRSFKEGKYYCRKCANKIYHSGENNSQWKSSLTRKCRELHRSESEYLIFKKAVLLRDGYKCVCCHKNYKLKVHHLDGFDNYINKRFDINNGVTLCENCHKNFHLKYGRGNNTKEQFEEWYGSTKHLFNNKICNLQETKQIYCFETQQTYTSTTDVQINLHFGAKGKKEIIEMCNLKGNVYSVYGYHFLWYENAKDMSPLELNDYILNHFDNPRRPMVLDLKEYKVFDNGYQRDIYYGYKNRKTNYYTRTYKKMNEIITHGSECILYSEFKKLTDKEKINLIGDKKISYYKGVI